MVDVVYLSPHLDDGVLSCGGQIVQQARAGKKVQVVTVFAGDGQGALSPFANSLHRRWGLDDDAPAARRAEDRAALAVLGAAPAHWDLAECIYRRDADGNLLYTDESALWGAMRAPDAPLVEHLAQRIALLPEAADLRVPLGAGEHVDHRLVRLAAEAARRPLDYYEEYPYGEHAGAVAAALGERLWEQETIYLDETALTAKVAAVACYRSQISTFWADEEEMAARVRAYALQVGAGRPAERICRPAER